MADHTARSGTPADAHELRTRLEKLQLALKGLDTRIQVIEEEGRAGRLADIAHEARAAAEPLLAAALVLEQGKPPEVGAGASLADAWHDTHPEGTAQPRLDDPGWWYEQLLQFFRWQLRAELDRTVGAAEAAHLDALDPLQKRQDRLQADVSDLFEKVRALEETLKDLRPACQDAARAAEAARAEVARLADNVERLRRIGGELQSAAGGLPAE